MHYISEDRNELVPDKIRVLVPRKMFGYKRDEVTGKWGKLHSEELRILYFSPCSL